MFLPWFFACKAKPWSYRASCFHRGHLTLGEVGFGETMGQCRVRPCFSLKSCSYGTLSAIASPKVSLEAHQQNVEGEVLRNDHWAQEPSITLQFWFRSALTPSI